MVSFGWSNLDFSVETENEKNHILKDISGWVKGGETLAILGPSGSGKTSLLKMLGGQTKPGNTSQQNTTGDIRLNNTSYSYEEYPYGDGVKLVSFVEQHDNFEGNVTVFEHLNFHASLRHFDITQNERHIKIRQIMARLRLEHCEQRMVQSLSGGEQKRLSIAEEMLNDQTCVLLLDEPTSGLDSTVAREVVEILYSAPVKKTGETSAAGSGVSGSEQNDQTPGGSASNTANEGITNAANKQVTIIFTIHQPSSLIWSLFDSVYFMGKGEVTYFGAADTLVNRLQSMDFQCPAFYNPAEYCLDLIQNDEQRGRLVQYEKNHGTTEKFGVTDKVMQSPLLTTNSVTKPKVEPSKSEPSRAELTEVRLVEDGEKDGDEAMERAEPTIERTETQQSKTSQHSQTSTASNISAIMARRKQAPWITEFRIIFKRTFVARLRKRLETHLSILVNLVLLSFTGVIFYDIGTHPKKINNRNGVLWFYNVHPVFSACFEAMVPLVTSASIIQKEFKTQRLYRFNSWFFARTHGELPIIFVYPLLFTIFMTVLPRLKDDPYEWETVPYDVFVFLIIAATTTWASSSLGQGIGSFTKDLEIGISLVIVVVAPMLMLNGLFVDPEQLPDAFGWIKYVSIFYWSWNAYICWCWQDVTLERCTIDEALRFPDDCAMLSGNQILKDRFSIDVEETPNLLATSLLVLFSYGVLCKLIALLRMSLRYEYDDNLKMCMKRHRKKKEVAM